MTTERAKEILLELLKPGDTVYIIRTNHGQRSKARYAILARVGDGVRNISNYAAKVMDRPWHNKGNESSINWNDQELDWPIMGLSLALFGNEKALKVSEL